MTYKGKIQLQPRPEELHFYLQAKIVRRAHTPANLDRMRARAYLLPTTDTDKAKFAFMEVLPGVSSVKALLLKNDFAFL